jgi:hypothetical protein
MAKQPRLAEDKAEDDDDDHNMLDCASGVHNKMADLITADSGTELRNNSNSVEVTREREEQLKWGCCYGAWAVSGGCEEMSKEVIEREYRPK